MRIFRSAYQASLSALIAGGAFGTMAILFLLSPTSEEPIGIASAPQHEAVFVADLSEIYEELAETETKVEVAAPEAAPLPEPVEELASAVGTPIEAPEVVEEPPPANAVARPARQPLDWEQRREQRREQAAAQRASEAGEPTGKRKRNCEDESDSIAQIGSNHYKVERELVDYYAGDMSEAMKLAVVHWAREDGEVVGFKVRRIKCGSVLHQAGFRNGDVIHSINGRPVRTIPQALSAYRKLRKKRRLEVVLTRKTGEALSLRYKLS